MCVLVPPVVVINNDLIQSQLYENITLECSVSSRPIARIYWERQGRIIEENQMSITQINQTMLINQLKIQMNNEDDFGQYNCIAENIHGRKEAIVFILSMCLLFIFVVYLNFSIFRRISYSFDINNKKAPSLSFKKFFY
jgi:hypothetical protein